MSDYKIQIGTELNTKGIDTGINKYHRKKTIEFKSQLDTSGIDKKLASYKAKKPIEVDAKLNTTGLAKKIGEYKPKTPIKLSAKLDTKDIDAIIRNYKAKKPIEVGVKLNHSAISEQIRTYKAKAPIKLSTRLDNKEISSQIKNYQAKTPIKLSTKLTTKDIDEKIRAYKAKTPIKLDVKINKGAINEQIKGFVPKSTIQLKASLQKGVIAEEIRKFKPSTPIKVDLELDPTDIDNKISAYKSKPPVEIPAKLKLNISDINEQLRKYKLTIPIKINVEQLDTKSLEEKIKAYNVKSAIKVGVQLDGKGISEQIAKLPRPTTPLNIAVKLNESAINDDIALFQPTATLGIQPDLILENVDDQIRAYVPQAKIKVNVDLDDSDISSETGKQKTQTPIKVNVKLDREKINEQIRNFTTKTKIKVGVKLDFASNNGGQRGISQQIKDYKTKSRIKVGVELDKDDVRQQIQTFKTDTPLRLNVELNTENVQTQIDTIRQQLQGLGDIRINLGTGAAGNGVVSGGGDNNGRDDEGQIDEVTQSYRELMGVLNELNSKRLQLNKLDASSPESSNKIQKLRLQIEQLEQEYQNLINSFNAQGIKFTADQWNQLETAMARVGRRIDVVQAEMSDKSAIKSQTQAYRELLSISKEIGSLEINIEKLKLQGGNSGQIEVLENQLRTLQSTYQQLVTSMKTPLTSDQWSAIYTQIAQTSDKVEQLKAKYADTRAELAKSIKGNFSGYDAQVESLEAKIQKLSDKSAEVKTGISSVKQALIDMREAIKASDDNALIEAEERYQRALRETEAQLLKNKSIEQQENYEDSFAIKKEAAIARLNGLFENGSQAAKRFGAEAQILYNELNQVGNISGIDNVIKKISNLEKRIKSSNLQTKTFTTRLKDQFSKYGNYLSVASVMMYAAQGLRSMFEQVKLIDSAMTELKKVTNETDESYNRFLNNAAVRSKELGTTLEGLVSSTADFARLGYGFKDSQGLAEVANIYAVVGDEIDGVEDATQSLISTLAAFKDEMGSMDDSEFALSIVDKMNEVSNNYAISSGGIGEALQRSASSMSAANNTLDETIAMITAANEVAQNPEKVGNAMKTISMRIRGAKTELEEAGESTDGMAESTAKMRQEIMALSGVDIMLNENTFKSTYQIMDELANKWEDLSDIAQASIIELMAGKHQGNVFASLMQNFDVAREALDTSLTSSGSAMQEHAKWSESLEARLNKLKAAWQGLSQAFLSSDFLKGALDAVIGLVDGITKLIDTFGALPTLLTGFTMFRSAFSNNGIFRTFNTDLDGFINKLGIANKSFAELANAFKSENTGGFKGFINGLKSVGNALVNTLSDADLSAIKSYNKLIDEGVDGQTAFAQTMSGTSAAAQDLARNANGSKIAIDGMKTATIGSKVALIGAKVAAVAFNAALTMGISLLINWAVSGIQKVINAKEELAERVEEITSKFKEQHKELLKLKGNYDTTNETSMISKYEKLSKGVDNLGRNVSLTSDEYSEYQSIVNTIAEQIPSLVSGYDEQGNALLSCKGNVEELTAAYEKLIHAQNQEILTNTKDIEDNFKNIKKDAESSGIWEAMLWGGRTGREMNAETVKVLEDIYSGDVSGNKISEILNNSLLSKTKIAEALRNAGVDVSSTAGGLASDEISKTLSKLMETDPSKIKGIIDNYYSQFDEVVEQKKSIAQAKLSEAFDIDNVNYGNINEDLQAVARQMVNSLDWEFFTELSDKNISVEQWTKDMLDQLNAINKEDGTKIEAAFDLQTQFNGGEISYGEYVDELENTGELIERLNLEPELESQLKLSLGLDEDGLVKEYQQLRNRLADNELFDIMPSEYEPFLKGLSSEELSVLIDIIPELSETEYKETIEDVKAALKKEMMLQGLTFDLNLEVEASGLEALNTALAESVSATGLSSESIAALKSRYSDLEAQGYDLSAMFEETSHGIRLNRQEFNKLEKAYATEKLADIDSDLSEMKSAYDDLGEAIKNCDDPIKKSELFNDRQTLAKRISEAATLASQYEGLTSAYNDWLSAEEAGQERDMYENIIKGFETVDDEISRGWMDDGAIEFLELLTGRTDLAGKSGKQLKEIYDGLGETIENTGYSIRDFFTVDEDGNSTNTGVYNFLDAIGQLEEEKFNGKDVVKRDKDGNIIGFDFELAGGDEVIAEALGVSKELVQIMVRAADDAGFVVSMDGTYRQLADLQNEAKSAADYLKEIGKTDFEFDFNTTSVENLKTQLEEAHKILDNKEFWNADGTFNFNADGATQAMQVVSTLQAKLDKLTEEKYGIGLTVEDEKFEEPLEYLQNYGRKVATLNQLKLNPETNAEEIKKLNGELDDISKYFANLDSDLKVDLGFEADDNWEEVKKKIESGEVEIPTVLDIQANMDKNIETLTDLALLNSGLLSDSEEETIRKKYRVEVEAEEVDTSDVDNKIDNAVSGAVGGALKGGAARQANIEIIAKTFGIEDVDDLSTKLDGLDDKTVEAVAKAIGKINVDELKQAVALLEPKEVEAIANAIGKGDVVELSDIIGQLSPKTVDAIAKALGYDDVNDLKIAIEDLDPKTVQAVAEALGITDVDSLKGAIDNLQPKTVQVSAETSGESKLTGLKGLIDSIKSKTVTITSWFKKIVSGGSTRNDSNGFNEVDGTANVNGTTGRAFKQGSWGTKNSGTALVGELGRETLVRDGRYYTIGDAGAEFIKYRKDDIIFNHKQTEELFKNGRVTSNGGRGKALASGTAFSRGSGGFGKVVEAVNIDGGRSVTKTKTKTKTETETETVTIGGSGGKKEGLPKTPNSKQAGDKDGNSGGSSEKFEETFDWVEVAISRIERAIDQLDRKANNIYKTWSDRNNALTSEISKVGDEIKLQQKAYDKYIQEANSVGLSSSWAEKVRNGEIDIDTITDESLAEKIKDYQDYYEKALDCKDAIEELKETEAELYAQRLKNVSAQYEGILSVIEHEKNMLEEYISQSEAQGWLVSANYYNALASNEKDNISQLKKEKAAMLSELQTAMESGTIAKNSEAWYEMVASVDEVTLAIIEGETRFKEYAQTLQQLSWETFDLLQEKISVITEETEFLIDLMSSDKLFDDNGQLTDSGSATMGLHGVAYNTNMYQADLAAKEAEKLKEQLAQDPYDTELEERYREMISLQQEYILSAQQEKEAIRDLVSEGIELELDALSERIDKYNESIEAAKDLYDYQKDVQKQTEEIASLEKQRAAYLGDNSEEGKAKLQEVEVSLKEARENLQETEYDKYISDTQQMLDDLSLQYSEILNTRLDNLDALVSDVITQINTDATSISATLSEKADSVCYTLSSSMTSIWDTNSTKINSVITTYGEKFSTAQTTTNNALNTINTNLQSMITQLNKMANTNVKSASTSSAANSKQADAKKEEPKKETAKNTDASKSTIKVGGMIDASGAPIYDYAGDKTAERQLYRNDPKYKVLQEKNGYILTRWHKLSSGATGWFKKSDVKALATGAKKINANDMAWTQEKGQEYIVRPSDGAILTPVAKGDSVLNAAASNNIWDMANSPADFIKDNLNLGAANVPNNSNVQNSYTQHLDKVVFNLPNVKNYDELLSAMQKDKNFERLINSITINKIAGGSGLAKGKSIR